MRQRPQFLLDAFASAGHPVYFVDPREAADRTAGDVTIVSSMNSVPAKHVILYIHFAPLRELIDRFDDAVVVYDILDDLSIYEPDEVGLPVERTVAHHHQLLVDRADEMIVSNPVLHTRHLDEHDGLLLVPNGVDATQFSTPRPRPTDLIETDQPLIGYRGAVGEWFDFALLESVAQQETDWRFVIVGPIYDRVADRAEEASRLPNVDFLGERPSDEMPAYAQAFDVEAIWFIVNEMTSGVTPLKMYESLASGTPVVSTPLPACVTESNVRTAADPVAFRSALHDALEDARDPAWRERAVAIAFDADWSNRIAPLLERLDERDRRRVP